MKEFLITCLVFAGIFSLGLVLVNGAWIILTLALLFVTAMVS